MSTTESRHAYMIMAHADMPQLHKLLSLLDDPRNELFLHVDKRCREFRPEEFKPQQAKLHLLERQCVYWGDHSQIALELRLFAAAREAGHHVIYHLLSGSDMPLKTQDEIHTLPRRRSISSSLTEIRSSSNTATPAVVTRFSCRRWSIMNRTSGTRSMPLTALQATCGDSFGRLVSHPPSGSQQPIYPHC